MRILCVVGKGTWVTPHIVESLQEGGHRVHTYYYGSEVGEFYGHSRAQLRAKKNHELVHFVKEFSHESGFDLIFCYVYDDFLLPATARALASQDIPMVNYNVDMINQWHRQTRTARFFTRMLCAQRENMRELARYNPRVRYFPMAGRKPLEASGGSFQPGAPVTFVGTPMPYRVAVLGRLHRAGIPLAICGK